MVQHPLPKSASINMRCFSVLDMNRDGATDVQGTNPTGFCGFSVLDMNRDGATGLDGAT